MSYYDELSPIYTFSLCITEEGSTIVDTTVNVKATAEEITRAKQTIQRLLDTYALAIEPLQASESELWNQPPVDPADQPKPETVHIPPFMRKPEGARGLLRLFCPECGSAFGTFLREYQTEFECKCGCKIDLTGALARYRFTCPYCEQESYGKTNSEAPEIDVQCKCREMVTVRWNKSAREYQN